MGFLKKIWKAVDGSKTKIGAALYAAGEAIGDPTLKAVGAILIALGGGHAAVKSLKKAKKETAEETE
jgi:hypothetical protein